MEPPRSRSFDDETEIPGASGATTTPAPPATRRATHVAWTDARGAHHEALGAPRTVVGAADTVDVVVADPTVSRLHAEFEVAPDGAVWVRDLGSKNGTFVEGIQVRAARVPDGARVQVGRTVLQVTSAPTPGVVVDLWPSAQFGALLGGSAVMREMFARLARVAATDSTVLIQGETGTGKELVARAVHEHSARRERPFIVVDCAALPDQLLEGELFGHARGAFTGANAARAGVIEAAEGGTVFLDEIGEMPLAMQPKLLRVLESRTVRRLGEASARPVNVRFVSATHRDLREMVNAGGFREDLYFRLAVVPIAVPPLRARPEDIPALVRHFVARGAGALPDELVGELSRRPWFGNVRELRNVVERALALGPRAALDGVARAAPNATSPNAPAPAAPPPPPAAPAATAAFPPVPVDRPFRELRDAWLDHLEREYIRQLLAAHNRNVSAVAQAAGLARQWVHTLIRKHNL